MALRKIRIKKNKKGKKSKYDLVLSYFSRVLDQHQIIQLDHMIQKGDIYDDIIPVLQEEWKCFTDIAARTLKDKLVEYNKYVLKPKILAKIDNVDVYNTLLSMKDKVDAVQEFTLLVFQQKKRVERLISAENELYATTGERPPKELASQTRKELKLLADSLEKLAKLQLETGVLKRAPRLISGEFQRMDEKDPKKIQFQITENFHEVLNIIEGEFKDLELIDEQKAIPAQTHN